MPKIQETKKQAKMPHKKMQKSVKKRISLCWCYYPHMLKDSVPPVCGICKASALWADAFYKSRCASVCVSVCPSVCVFTFTVYRLPFKRLCAPTSRNRMSNIFRDSESLGKTNGKKWPNI